MAVIETLKATISRTLEFEKVELEATVRLQPGDKISDIRRDLEKSLNANLDEMEQNMKERQAIRRQLMEKEKMTELQRIEEEQRKIRERIERLPKTKEDAYKVRINDDTTLEDCSLKELKEYAEGTDMTDPVVVGAKILTGKHVVDVPVSNVNVASHQVGNVNDDVRELEILLAKPIIGRPLTLNKYGKDYKGVMKFDGANERELSYIANTFKKATADDRQTALRILELKQKIGV